MLRFSDLSKSAVLTGFPAATRFPGRCMSVSISELSDRSPALRLDSPGVIRLRGPGLTLHRQGQISPSSTSVYGLRATPGDHRLTQRGEVLCGVHIPVHDHPARHTDVRTLRKQQFGRRSLNR
jgi:hypothetical protein